MIDVTQSDMPCLYNHIIINVCLSIIPMQSKVLPPADGVTKCGRFTLSPPHEEMAGTARALGPPVILGLL